MSKELVKEIKEDMSKLSYLQEQLRAAIQRVQFEIMKEDHKKKQASLRRAARNYTEKLIYLSKYRK